MDLWSLITAALGDNPTALAVITAAVSVASALDAVLPQPAAGSPWLLPRKLLSFVAINLGHAQNAKQPPMKAGDGRRTLGSLAVLLMAGSLILPGCASVNRDDALAAGEATYAIARQASEMYATLPDHKPEVAAAAHAAVKTLRSALDAAKVAHDAGNDSAYPIAMAAVSTAATEAMVYVYTYRVAITNR